MTQLRLVEAGDEAEAIMDAVFGAMRVGALKFTCPIGYQGGGTTADVYWRPDLSVWSLMTDHDEVEGRFWFCLGTEEPSEGAGLAITCEINPPTSGINRRCAGVIARHPLGAVYLGHTGRVGGGRAGIGMAAFREFQTGGTWASVEGSDGKSSEMLLIGQVGDPLLAHHVAAFVHEVERFKRHAAAAS